MKIPRRKVQKIYLKITAVFEAEIFINFVDNLGRHTFIKCAAWGLWHLFQCITNADSLKSRHISCPYLSLRLILQKSAPSPQTQIGEILRDTYHNKNNNCVGKKKEKKSHNTDKFDRQIWTEKICASREQMNSACGHQHQNQQTEYSEINSVERQIRLLKKVCKMAKKERKVHRVKNHKSIFFAFFSINLDGINLFSALHSIPQLFC